MKIFYIVALGLVLGAYSSINFAERIFDTYTTGDTLTAEKLENIKFAVNGNDDRVRALEPIFSGDGSAGTLFLAGNVNWVTDPPTNPYFSGINLASGTVLTVPAGTTIRCGIFINQGGTIIVEPGPAMGSTGANATGSTNEATQGRQANAHPGDTPRSASIGGSDFTSLSTIVLLAPPNLFGGDGGMNIPRLVAMTSPGNFRIGGGAGASYRDGRGGGLLKIYADSQIVNQGTILAQGEDATLDPGTGGGGGGIVILASRGLVDNSVGAIDVSGGDGAGGDASIANGGGGGGGIVVMAAPDVRTAPGNEIVSAGAGGASGTAVISLIRSAGGGGGGSGGQGGRGADVNSAGAPGFGTGGDLGYVINLAIDPIAIAR
jgi:hypothetical protein